MRCFQFAALFLISSRLTSASGAQSVLVTPEGQVQSSQNHVRKERARIKKIHDKASSIQDYVVDSQGQFTLSNEERLSDKFIGQHPNTAMLQGNSNMRQQHSQQHPTAALDSMDSVLLRKKTDENSTTQAPTQATTQAPSAQASTTKAQATNVTTTAQAEWGGTKVNWLNPLTWFGAPSATQAPAAQNTTQAPATQASTQAPAAQASTTTAKATTTTTTAKASSGWAGWFGGGTTTQAPTDQASTSQAPAQGGQSSTRIPPGVPPTPAPPPTTPSATATTQAPTTQALATTPAPPPTPRPAPTPAPPPTPSPPPIDMEFGGKAHGVNIDDHDKKEHYTYQTRPEAVKSKACDSNGCKECTELSTCFHGVTKPWPNWGGAWGFLSVDVPAGGSFTHYTAEVWAHCSSQEGTWWIWSSPDRVSNGILNVFVDGEGGSQEVVKSWTPKNKEDDGQYIELKDIKEGKSRIRVEFFPDLAKGGTAEIWLEASKVDSMVDECMGVKNCLRDVADGTNESFELRNSNDDQMLCLTGATQNMSPAMKLKCQEWEVCLTQTKKKEEVLALLEAATMTWDTTTTTTTTAQAPTQAPTQAATEAATQAPTEAATQTTTQAATETSTTTTQAPTEAATQAATEAATTTRAATETSTTTTQAPTEAATQAATQAPAEAATQAPTQAATETSTTTTQAATDAQAATQTATETSTTTTQAPTDTQAATQAASAEAAPTQASTQTTTTTQATTQAPSTTQAPTNASQSGWFSLLETRRLNKPQAPTDAAMSTGDIASRCIDPTTDDPESWDCDCAEVWTEKCQEPQNNGQPLATCLNLVMCSNSRICCSWKQDHCPLQYKCSVGQSRNSVFGSSLASADADGAMLQRSSASATQKSDTIQETRDHMDDSLMGKCTG